MDIDNILSQFGEKAPATSSGKFNADEILSMFGDKTAPETVEQPKKKAASPTGEPKPPISGISKESSDEINAQRALKGGENPRRKLPTTNIGEAAYNADVAGKEMFSSGIEDLSSGKPYKGATKTALGAFMRVSSPMTGIVEGGIGTPLIDITGNEGFGNRAAIVAGSAVPTVPGAGAAIKILPKIKSLRTLVESIGPENLPMVVREMKANPRLAPADLSPKVLQDTQHLFASDGPQINYLKNASDARMAGSKAVVETAYDSATGLPVNGVQKLKDLKKAASDVGSGLINPAIKSAKPVDISPVLDHIDAVLKPGVNKVITSQSTLPSNEINKQLAQVRSMLANSKEQRTDPAALHEFQSVLRQTADSLLNSTDGASRRMGNALMNVRNELVNAIDKSASGTYKPALAKYRDAKQIDDAFHEGYNSVFTNSKKLEGRPEFTEEWFKGLSDAEKQAAREGARLQLDTTIHNTRFAARKGTEVPQADFNRKKLELLFGKEETEKLLKTLNDERTIANTHNKIVEGSQTAMRSASKEQFALPTASQVGSTLLPASIVEGANVLAGGTPLLGTAAYLGLKGVDKAKDAVKMKLAREHNAQYAKLALPTEGPSRDQLIKQLESFIPQPKMTLLNKVRTALPTKP